MSKTQDQMDHIIDQYNQARKWLLSLITDPEGRRYFEEKSAEVRLQEFREQIDRTGKFLAFAGNPQTAFKSVHVAGTSGKGSVVNMIAAILRAGGLKTGYHVSPYLQVCNEKLIVDEEMISPSEFIALVDGFRGEYEKWISSGGEYTSLKYGEAWVALTYLWMAKCGVDWAVIETGLGGRYDPTNVLPSSLAVITNVNYDHIEVIGPSLEEIAHHKAGIIKEGRPVVTSETKPEVLAVIQKEAAEKKARLFRIGEDFDFRVDAETEDGAVISVETPYQSIDGIRVAMKGHFQPVNAALSAAGVDILSHEYGLEITAQDIKNGLGQALYPGRLEVVQEKPMVILDGAHNHHKMEALAESLKSYYPDKKITAIVGMLMTKDAKGMVETLMPLVKEWLVTQPHVLGKPAVPPQQAAEIVREISPQAKIQVYENVQDGLEEALSRADAEDLIVVTGSLYLVGEARERWYPTRQLLADLENRG